MTDECTPTCAPHLQQFCAPLCESEASVDRLLAEVERLTAEVKVWKNKYHSLYIRREGE